MDGKMHSGRELKVKTAGTDSSRGRDSRPAGRGHLRPSGQPCRSLFVAGIPTTQAERDLHDHFSTYGRLSHVKLLPQNQKSATLAAFVDFDHIDDAILAYETKDLLKGQVLRIEYRHQQPPSRLPADMPHDDRRAPPPSSRSGEPALPPPLHSNRASPRSDDRYTPHLRNDGRYLPLPCYGNRFDERDRHDDRRAPPSPYSQRYDDRNGARRYDRDPPLGYDNRGPPHRRHEGFEAFDRGAPPRERDYYDDRRGCAGGMPLARARGAHGLPPPHALAPCRAHSRQHRAGAAKEET